MQYGVLLDAESEVSVGRTIGNETELEVFALEAGVATATWAVPTAAIFAAGSAARSWAELD